MKKTMQSYNAWRMTEASLRNGATNVIKSSDFASFSDIILFSHRDSSQIFGIVLKSEIDYSIYFPL